MKLRSMIVLSTVLIAAVIGWDGIGAPARGERAVRPAAQKVDAESLYANYCAKCHGTDGKSLTRQGKQLNAQDFTSSAWRSRTTVDEAAATIRDGDGEMPSYLRRLNTAQTQALANYVKSFPH